MTELDVARREGARNNGNNASPDNLQYVELDTCKKHKWTHAATCSKELDGFELGLVEGCVLGI